MKERIFRKRKICALSLVLVLFLMVGCGKKETENGVRNALTQTETETGQTVDDRQEDLEAEDQGSSETVLKPGQEVDMKMSILVAYFSDTGTTKPVAEYAAEFLNADLYEIVPEEPYTEADLAYYTDGRADQEQSDPTARPAISGSVEDMEQYGIVLLGYPIWLAYHNLIQCTQA